MELVEIWLYGALTEIVGDENYLLDELKKLNINGYKIEISKKIKNGITGTYVNVIVDGKDEYGHIHSLKEDSEKIHHSYELHKKEDDNYNYEFNNEEKNHKKYYDKMESHHHEHRNLKDVNEIIDNSSLKEGVKDLAKKIFLRVAKAESKVHNKSLEEVHFHEVGAIDSIIDIVGTAILIDKINPDKIISSVVNDGYGFIECAHGTMSVPVPATSEIFAESSVKFRQIDVDTELVTPTGAAIISELAEEFINLPAMVTEKIGWGAGYKDLKIPNILKV